MKSSRFLNRKVPALVMRLTRKWPGYSIGRSRASYERGERSVARRGRSPSQMLVRPLLVVLPPEVIEGPLLGDQRRARGPNRVGLQGLVHPLMGAVLLRVARRECVGAECRVASTTR